MKSTQSNFSVRSSPSRTRRVRKGRFANRRAMAADMLVVTVWAATIPGLMWLGAVSGF